MAKHGATDSCPKKEGQTVTEMDPQDTTGQARRGGQWGGTYTYVQARGHDERPPILQTQPPTAPLPYGELLPPHPPTLSNSVLSSLLAALGWAARFLFLQGQCSPQAPGSGLPWARSSPKTLVLQPAELPEYQQCSGLCLQIRPPGLESSSARRIVPMAPLFWGPPAVGGVSVAP